MKNHESMIEKEEKEIAFGSIHISQSMSQQTLARNF